MSPLLFSLLLCILAAGPACLFLFNLRLFRPPAESDGEKTDLPGVSVLIPARNEEGSIGKAAVSALNNPECELEVVVMDDDSSDNTAAEVEKLARKDARVRLEKAPPLPEGWNGKQHACFLLAERARGEILVFMDADVRLRPGAVVRMIRFLEESGADLVSGFPRQVTKTLMEKLVIPLIDFILLGFLPLKRMRNSASPAYAAGCGQLMIARREPYRISGGHGAIRRSRHDGIALPRAFRKAGFLTDIFDAGPIARCRMYRTGGEVWEGFAKNAGEGMAAPARILPFTLILGGGQVLPLPWLAGLLLSGAAPAAVLSAAGAVILSYLPALLGVFRFGRPALSALLHPAGMAVLLSIQWWALAQRILKVPSRWKGRAYRQ